MYSFPLWLIVGYWLQAPMLYRGPHCLLILHMIACICCPQTLYLPFIGNLYLFTHFLLPKQTNKQTNKPATLSLSLRKVFLHVELRVEEYWGHFPVEPYYLTNKKTGWELSPATSMAESLTPGLPLTPQDFSSYQCLAMTLHSIKDIWVD